MSRPRRIILHGAALALLLLSPLAWAEDTATPPPPKKKSSTGAVLRSMVVPGWGQLYTESYIKAVVFAGIEGSLIIGISHQHDQMKAFQKAGDFSAERFYRNSRNRLVWWLAGTILLSMGDAYVDAQLYGLDVSPNLTPLDGTVGITVSYKF